MLATISTQTTKSIVTATEAITSPPLSMHLHHHPHHHFNHNDISSFLLLMMLPISFTCYHCFYCTNTVITLHCCHLYLADTTITLPTTLTIIVTTKTPMPLECLLPFSHFHHATAIRTTNADIANSNTRVLTMCVFKHVFSVLNYRTSHIYNFQSNWLFFISF